MQTFTIVLTYTTTGTEPADFYEDRIRAWPMAYHFTGSDEPDALRIDGVVACPVDADHARELRAPDTP